MEELALTYFPFPHIHKGTRRQGFAFEWPERCNTCARPCERDEDTRLHICSYGVNYYRFDKDFLVFGVVVRDFASNLNARVKMARLVRKGPYASDLEDARRVYNSVHMAEATELRARMDRVIQEYRESEECKRDLVELLKPEMKKMLAQIHDYRQFVSQVVQNVNVILEMRSPGLNIEQQLATASHEEVAIYWAAKLMEEKIESALFLNEPERIDDRRQFGAFRLHGCVLKYLRIYQRSFDKKSIEVRVIGESHGLIYGNFQALSVIPHTLLDNALKYAPRNSTISISFDETDTEVKLAVRSLGPRIDADERHRIFDLFYRGKHASRLEPDGTGFGLHLAQLIARKHGTQISVRQDCSTAGGLCLTEFSISFDLYGRPNNGAQRVPPARS